MSAKEKFKEQFQIKTNDYSKIKKIIGIVSGKGGVGKSLVTSLTAIALRRAGYSVGILDADITGASIPKVFGINDILYAGDTGILPQVSALGIKIISANLMMEDPSSPIIWRSPMITQIIKQFYSEVDWGELDYLLIDMPPGTGDVPLTVFQSIPLDGIVVVSTPQDLVSLIVEKSIKMAEQMEINVVGLVENMSYVVCDECGHHIELFGNKYSVADRLNTEVVAKLPLDPRITEACDEGKLEYLPFEYCDELVKKLEQL